MAIWQKLKFWKTPAEAPHLQKGNLGERAARDFLKKKGLKFLVANFSSRRGEIDLIFRDGRCLVFIEVKTRSSDSWSRPARAVTMHKRRTLARTAQDYLRLLEDSQVPFRFDIVEVLLENGSVREIRHIENGFNTANLYAPDRRVLSPR
jgi:putative endonuclease